MPYYIPQSFDLSSMLGKKEASSIRAPIIAIQKFAEAFGSGPKSIDEIEEFLLENNFLRTYDERTARMDAHSIIEHLKLGTSYYHGIFLGISLHLNKNDDNKYSLEKYYHVPFLSELLS